MLWGGSDVLVINVMGEWSDQKEDYVCQADKTAEEICTAYEQGRIPIARIVGTLAEENGIPHILVATGASRVAEEIFCYFDASTFRGVDGQLTSMDTVALKIANSNNEDTVVVEWFSREFSYIAP